MNYKLHCYFHSLYRIPSMVQISDSITVEFVSCGKECSEYHRYVDKGAFYELFLSTSSEKDALVIVDLLCAAYTVVSGYNTFNPKELMMEIMPEEEKKRRFLIPSAHHIEDDIYWFFAAKLVEKIYSNQTYENAVCRYHTAHEIIDLHPMELHPFEDEFQEDYSLTEQIRIANLIIVCQSVLEELGINVSKKGVALLDNNNNEWSKPILDQYSCVLQSFGIECNKTIPWLFRMGLSASAENTVLDKSHLCEWSKGIIHDYEMKIIDGILELKRLRNKIGAHTLENRVLKLSIYDVENAFSLVRTVLLDYFKINVFEVFPALD